jgi:16S rRNA (cytosine1402-N4)-methyltransferase|tara:strand:- start:3646 stop:4563 length:918 start_codon:yes stop_codon:yes gene_type:complete
MTSNGTSHIPVLLHEVIEGLALKPGDTVVDGTVNGGGHAKALCETVGENGTVLGIDLDADAITRARKNVLGPCKVELVEGSYRNLDTILSEKGIHDVQGVLFDFGLSSDQLDTPAGGPGRGFSFTKDEPLLMTFAQAESKLTAREIVNEWDEKVLRDILLGYGEERYARKIAEGIVETRREKPIETTFELLEVIRNSVPERYQHKRLHFATRTFQALRIAVNDELECIEEGLSKAFTCLKPGGRIVAISFHSLEGRTVKLFFKEKKRLHEGVIITKKPIVPEREEVIKNPRARSAKLRIIEKHAE